MSRIIAVIFGTYMGVYAAQNYELPKAPGPSQVLEYFTNWIKQFDNNGKDR